MKNSLMNYDLDELIAIVRYLLIKSKAGLDKIHISKILYYAQQEHLVRYAMPLCADSFAAKKLGPVPMFVDRALNALSHTEEVQDDQINKFIEGLQVTYHNNEEGKDVAVYSLAPGYSFNPNDISESAMQELDKSLAKYENMASGELSRLSHEDEAWQIANKQFLRTGEPAIMPLYDIAKAGGALPGMLDEIKNEQLLNSVWQ